MALILVKMPKKAKNGLFCHFQKSENPKNFNIKYLHDDLFPQSPIIPIILNQISDAIDHQTRNFEDQMCQIEEFIIVNFAVHGPDSTLQMLQIQSLGRHIAAYGALQILSQCLKLLIVQICQIGQIFGFRQMSRI